MARSQLIDPIADPAWLSFVEAGSSAGIFQHPRWLALLRDQYGYELQALCLEEGGCPEAGLPLALVESRLTGRRLVSLPFSDSCEPVLSPSASPQAVSALGTALAREVERSGLQATVHALLPDLPGAFVQRRYLRHRLPLSRDPAEVERHFSKSQVRRGIRKARREGLVAERHTGREALDAFYALHLKTRRKLGVPTQPKRFIRRFAGLFDAGLGFVELVLDAGRPIAAAVFLTCNGTITYKYGASDPGRLGKRPNNLLFDEVIRAACESGFQTLDFGRTDVDNEGLRSFKRSWGAVEEELPYTYLTESEPSPLPALHDRIASGTIRRSPAVVGRLAGEALYRHFG